VLDALLEGLALVTQIRGGTADHTRGGLRLIDGLRYVRQAGRDDPRTAGDLLDLARDLAGRGPLTSTAPAISRVSRSMSPITAPTARIASTAPTVSLRTAAI